MCTARRFQTECGILSFFTVFFPLLYLLFRLFNIASRSSAGSFKKEKKNRMWNDAVPRIARN
jgi:hypothetical protein